MAKEKKPGNETDLSRRDFLKGGAAGVVTTGFLAGRQAEARRLAGGVETVGPGTVPISLRINGQLHQLELEPRVTLLDALRDHLDLTGAKKVCDRATCGACSVQLDGKLVYACSVLAIEAQGKSIETIEGISTPDRLHAIQAAFVQHDGSQCGFCTPGFVMACKALLDGNPQPDEEEFQLALGGNLCRCGTYVGIREAVGEIAKGGMING
ncbi:MAG: 2Fe-2S iron-sulfur cluster-binding protein [Acidobacteriota bacterium]